jgi:hypothetical protein
MNIPVCVCGFFQHAISSKVLGIFVATREGFVVDLLSAFHIVLFKRATAL